MAKQGVTVRENFVSYPTYEPMAPDKHPMFLDKRVYQGSSGKVYPLPVYNRIASKPKQRKWKAVHLENQFIKIMVLPEIGGRIHIGQDKTNGYDFFYRQNVIKPALVGLAGPWCSGGVEFNWPQHHRPATWMPVDTHVEEHEDGSKTVWFSDHDPMARMKGMHGVCLHPGKAFVELKVRAYNRTPYVQTFLWWANVATRVHEGYQSFFPPDVTTIADHAKRATATYPLCEGSYYGVDYGSRVKNGVPTAEQPAKFQPPWLAKGKKKDIPSYSPNDLTWYANIPVPTSYMCVGSKEDFFGGYDHFKKAGVVHIANHHISPGKKQWTWGNHEFGYSWDRLLTDKDGPYIEIMAGVYTDNQPDFSFLQPGETKTWSQYWYPIRDIGVAQQANTDAAISLSVEGKKARVGVSVTSQFTAAVVELLKNGRVLKAWTKDLAPGKSFVQSVVLDGEVDAEKLKLRVVDQSGRELISYQPVKAKRGEVPNPAQEPVLPNDMKSADELYMTGLHLDQYRHATRKPEMYWLEALRRDEGDIRCNNGMGLRCLRRGEFEEAVAYFEKAIERLTKLNPNPYDGEAYYNLGTTLRFLGQDDEAYAALYKATWNQAWQAAAYHQIAELDCMKGDWQKAVDHLDRSLRLNTDNLRARDLLAVVLRKLGMNADAEKVLRETLALDPLDWWARYLLGEELQCDTQTRIDIALDFTRAGFYRDAVAVLQTSTPEKFSGTLPLVQYYIGWLLDLIGDTKGSLEQLKNAATTPSDYCFPSRLEDILVLQKAMELNPKDAMAPYYLGNLLYDKDRFEDAIYFWEESAKRDSKFSIVWRNLGIAYFNILNEPSKALAAFEKAVELNPAEARLIYERDQLWKRMGKSVEVRLSELEKNLKLVKERDDLAVELASLYNQTGQHEKALKIVSSREFQPWEGGEGLALGQHVRTNLALGRKALSSGDVRSARSYFAAALTAPRNLGESKHIFMNQSDVHYWLGLAYDKLGKKDEARRHWELAASHAGDFQNMSVRLYSELTYYTARALEALGKKAEAAKLFKNMLSYAKGLEKEIAKIDYFATSLPTMLLFNDELQFRQVTAAHFMQALANYGLGKRAEAQKLVKDVLKREPSHAAAADFAQDLAGISKSSAVKKITLKTKETKTKTNTVKGKGKKPTARSTVERGA